VNWRGGYVNVIDNWVQGKGTTTKNGRTRTVALPHRLLVLLRHQCKTRRHGPDDLIFPSEACTPLDVKLFRRRAWQRNSR
jgi:integrase